MARYFEVLFYDDGGALDHNGIMTEVEARVFAQGRRVRFQEEVPLAEAQGLSPTDRGLPEDYLHQILTEEYTAQQQIEEVNDDLPFPWNVRLEQDGTYAAFYGQGFRRKGFATAQAAADWAQENA